MRLLLLFSLIFACLAVIGSAAGNPPAAPRVLDKRLKLELFAAEPQIVTPTGIAVDDRGRVLCIESHTHFRPKDYKGPATDRIRMFQDTDGDGRADRITTFFEGTTYTMNLAVYHDGSIYVATRREVFRLRDKDNDGKADERTPIVRLETKGDYPHNGLSGFAFDFAGNVYFGFGENFGEPYKLIGSDGVTLTGGDAGNIYRCGPNGEKLHRIATGFWNPFHLATDSFGRLFAVDNDPDSRPPCRLLHIVEGGDYGFRFRLGRDGLHPFQSWNGEVPGTLPMVNGTGEAPSGIIAYESDGLPDDYFGDLLLTSWGDHRIERHRLTPRGASYGSKVEIIAKGNEDFRPVGIALAPDGSLYISDWVKRDYNLHNHGRIWRLRAATPTPISLSRRRANGIASEHRPTREAAAWELLMNREKGIERLCELARESLIARVRATSLAALSTDFESHTDLIGKIAKDDAIPEIRAFATSALEEAAIIRLLLTEDHRSRLVSAAACRRVFVSPEIGLISEGHPDIWLDDPFLRQSMRLYASQRWPIPSETERQRFKAQMQAGHDAAKSLPASRLTKRSIDALLVMRALKNHDTQLYIPFLLRTSNLDSRFIAFEWVAQSRLTQFRNDLHHALTAGPITQQLFDAYLATLEALDGQKDNRRWDQRVEKYVVDLVAKPDTPVEVRRLAVRRLRPNHPMLTAALFDELMATSDPGIHREAVRTFRESRRSERNERLKRVVQDKARPPALRADAVLGIDAQDAAMQELLVSTALSDTPALRDEALRSLRATDLTKEHRNRLAPLGNQSPAVRDFVQRVLEPNYKPQYPPATDLPAWQKLLDGKGDPEAGERIFFHPKSAGCSKCHQISARGGTVGPDLTLIAGQMSRERIIESIVNPSREIAPQYATWQVLKNDGSTFTGVFLGEDGARNQRYGDPQGNVIALKAEDIDDRQPTAKSLMPDDLPHQLTIAEFRDLLAFLTQRTAR
jgi:putative membrane-bound dehydrogenase-like protein